VTDFDAVDIPHGHDESDIVTGERFGRTGLARLPVRVTAWIPLDNGRIYAVESEVVDEKLVDTPDTDG